jgi:hypothetical protein
VHLPPLAKTPKGWTSPANIPYWAVIIHFMDVVQFKPASIVLALKKKEEQTALELVTFLYFLRLIFKRQK